MEFMYRKVLYVYYVDYVRFMLIVYIMYFRDIPNIHNVFIIHKAFPKLPNIHKEITKDRHMSDGRVQKKKVPVKVPVTHNTHNLHNHA